MTVLESEAHQGDPEESPGPDVGVAGMAGRSGARAAAFSAGAVGSGASPPAGDAERAGTVAHRGTLPAALSAGATDSGVSPLVGAVDSSAPSIGADPGRQADPGSPHPVTVEVPEVDGIPVSGLLAAAAQPRAVIVALHGGAVTSSYFDCPGHPELSLMRTAQRLGYTVLALDRPGFTTSKPYADRLVDPQRRVDLIYGAIEAVLGDRPRGGGTLVMAHSAGCELAVRVAADDRGAALLGLELAGTGRRHQPAADELLGAGREAAGQRPRGVGRLLWSPKRLYPPDVLGGEVIAAAGSQLEAPTIQAWAAREFLGLAPRIRIPVRFTAAEYEQVWQHDPDELAAIGALFTAAPRVVLNRQPNTAHNISVSYAAPAYHLGVLAFAEECLIARTTGEFSGPAIQFDGSAVARPGG